MQPCSHPRYGLIDCVNGTSGETLREMIVFARSIVTCVLSAGSSSSGGVFQPSSIDSRATCSKRPSGLMAAPRPLLGAACSPLTVLSAMDRTLANGTAQVKWPRAYAALAPDPALSGHRQCS